MNINYSRNYFILFTISRSPTDKAPTIRLLHLPACIQCQYHNRHFHLSGKNNYLKYLIRCLLISIQQKINGLLIFYLIFCSRNSTPFSRSPILSSRQARKIQAIKITRIKTIMIMSTSYSIFKNYASIKFSIEFLY